MGTDTTRSTSISQTSKGKIDKYNQEATKRTDGKPSLQLFPKSGNYVTQT